MFDKSLAIPRKDPLRASRIFLLASKSTLEDLPLGQDFEHQRNRAGRLLINALECLLVAHSERATGLEACEQTHEQCVAESHFYPPVSLGLDWGRRNRTSTEDTTELVLAINTLTSALDALRDGNQSNLQRFVPVFKRIAESLVTEESN